MIATLFINSCSTLNTRGISRDTVKKIEFLIKLMLTTFQIAEDSTKKSACDSLIVEVVKAPTIRPTVEFQMTLDYPFEMLENNANNKKKLVEKLALLFGDKDTSNIRIRNITGHPTTIIW